MTGKKLRVTKKNEKDSDSFLPIFVYFYISVWFCVLIHCIYFFLSGFKYFNLY